MTATMTLSLRSATTAEPSCAPALDVQALYRRHGAMVHGRCRRLLGNEADADEACQEVFLRVLRSAGSFRGAASPTTWLWTVTTNVCLSRLRTRRRRPEEPLADVEGVGWEPAVDAVAERRVVERMLVHADDRTRACIVYHVLDGMTYEETGELVGISASAVRKRLDRFRAAVRADEHLVRDL